MSINNGKVTAPIGVIEMARFLGCSHADTGTVCLSKNIDKYAKFKPIAWQSPIILTDTQRYELNHGFVPVYINIDPRNIPSGMPAWGQWRLPDPSKNEFCRITDFNGYNHNAHKLPFISGLEVKTNHVDGQSLVINNNTTTADKRIEGKIYVKISINQGADLKLSDFHWDDSNKSQFPLKNFYWCAALISPWLIEAGTYQYNGAYQFSDKTVGEIENQFLDTIEFEFDTAPNAGLNTAMSQSNPELYLIIGLVRQKSENTRQFWSPCIFEEWQSYPWLKLYTSSKKWTQQIIRLEYYFQGGIFNKGAYVSLTNASSGGRIYNMMLSGMEWSINVAPGTSSSLKPLARLSYRLFLQKQGSSNFVDKMGMIYDDSAGNMPAPSYHNFEGDFIGEVDFNNEVVNVDGSSIIGTYTGKLTLQVQGAENIVTLRIEGEPATYQSWYWSNDGTHIKELEIPINLYVT